MITRDELLKSPEYWFEETQNEIFRQITDYMEEEGLNQTQLAEHLGVTKGYVSQVVNGNFNYTLRKFIELALAIGRVPRIEYIPIEEYILDDRITKPLDVEGTTISCESNLTVSYSSKAKVA